MNEGLKKVLNAFATDEAFREKLGASKSPDEAYQVARTVADGYTQEEFQGMMANVKAAASEMDQAGGDRCLSEEDLRAVAGGAMTVREDRAVTSGTTDVDRDALIATGVGLGVGAVVMAAGSAI